MDNIIARYEDYLIHTKHASANTVSSYMRDIRQYASYLSGIDVDVLEADQSVVSAYMQWLQSIGKSPATVSRCLASLKSLYLFALSEDEIEQNPVHNIKLEKAEKKLPQILTGKEVELLLEQPRTSDMKGCRDKAMLEVLYATGIRVSELINLNVDDVSITGGFIRCESGGKTRIIPLYPEAVQALHTYMDDVRLKMLATPSEHSLFVNVSGERMSRQGFWKNYQILPGEGADRQGHHAAYPAAQLCRASAGERRGPSVHSGDAWSQRHFLYTGLRAPGQAESQICLQQISSESIKSPRSPVGLRGLWA